MNNKRWYQSQTILASLIGALIPVLGIATDCLAEKRPPNEIEITLIAGSVIATQKTIEGRLKAESKIGKDSVEVGEYLPVESSSEPIEVPDLDYIASLPSNLDPQESVDFTDTADFTEKELDVDLTDNQGQYKIEVIYNTKLKTSYVDSSLSSDKYKELSLGDSFFITGYKIIDSSNHIQVETEDGIFYLYVPHIKLWNNKNKEVSLIENSSPVPIINVKKTPLKLPGYSSIFYLEDSIIPNSNFTWAEATKNGQRIPVSKDIVENIVDLTYKLQELREYLGNKPIGITSWYRDPVSNRSVGGATRSQHLKGNAVDLYVVGIDIFELQEMMLNYWKGGVGKGAHRGFIHLDLGPQRQWRY